MYRSLGFGFLVGCRLRAFEKRSCVRGLVSNIYRDETSDQVVGVLQTSGFFRAVQCLLVAENRIAQQHARQLGVTLERGRHDFERRCAGHSVVRAFERADVQTSFRRCPFHHRADGCLAECIPHPLWRGIGGFVFEARHPPGSSFVAQFYVYCLCVATPQRR